MRQRPSPAAFCREWTTAADVDDAAARLDVSRRNVILRAACLRNRGVKLKPLRGEPVARLPAARVQQLNRFISQLATPA